MQLTYWIEGCDFFGREHAVVYRTRSKKVCGWKVLSNILLQDNHKLSTRGQARIAVQMDP
jgi:hypothetical protein